MNTVTPQDKAAATRYIKFFTSIPDKKWVCHKFKTASGRCCALGHLGATNVENMPQKARKLDLLMEKYGLRTASINDATEHSICGVIYYKDGFFQRLKCHSLGKTAKERIINALILIASGAAADLKD